MKTEHTPITTFHPTTFETIKSDGNATTDFVREITDELRFQLQLDESGRFKLVTPVLHTATDEVPIGNSLGFGVIGTDGDIFVRIEVTAIVG